MRIIQTIVVALVVSFAISGVALAVSSARYDFINGKPGLVDDATDSLTPRFDFVNGQPAIVDEQVAVASAVQEEEMFVSEE